MAGNKAFQLFLEVLKKYAQEVQFGILLEEQELLQRLMDLSYRYQDLLYLLIVWIFTAASNTVSGSTACGTSISTGF